MFIDFNMSIVSLSTSMDSTSSADFSGTKSMRRSRSSSWSLREMPRTGPRWMRFIKCCEKQRQNARHTVSHTHRRGLAIEPERSMMTIGAPRRAPTRSPAHIDRERRKSNVA
uniref:Uncharacterized protein n=1 Tax=Ostreococcus mediterraneus TaxID=1486918 RepID=A0A7S0KKZ8_9CHLO